MFGLFSSKQNGVKVIDKVWMSASAKWNACAEMARLNPDCLFVFWFDETRIKLQEILDTGNANILSANEAGPQYVQGRMVVFVEHYPLPKVEQDLFVRMGLKEAPVLTSLEEPLFQKFGGENLIEVLKKLGMNENEVIGHSMITKSIRRAQEKIAKQTNSDIHSTSQREWFERNILNS